MIDMTQSHLVLYHNDDLPDDTQPTAVIEQGATISSHMVRDSGIVNSEFKTAVIERGASLSSLMVRESIVIFETKCILQLSYYRALWV
jgi:hypothetical protein